jgi:hypothetical protein
VPRVVHHFGWRTEPSPAAALATDRRACAELLQLVEEALRVQRLAETLLDELHDRGSEPELGQRGASLMCRFVKLRRQLPRSSDVTVRRYVEIVDTVLDHHALHLSAALERIATHRPPDQNIESRTAEGLGHTAVWLTTVEDQLTQLQHGIVEG